MADTPRRGIVNIDAVLPPDIIFVVGGDEYKIRGNIEAKHAFQIQKLNHAQDVARETEDVEAFLDAAQATHDYLLTLFQEKQPRLTQLPWDLAQMNRIAGIVLARAMGADLESLATLGDPPSEAKTTTPAKPRPSSTRRTGSARS
jgi:hypothetical protein